MGDSITQKIYDKLGGSSGEYCGTTYGLSEGNTVTRLDTPGLWGHNPSVNDYWNKNIHYYTNLSPNCRKLLQEIEDTIASAETYLDITTLWHTSGPHGGFPDGVFALAIKRGFSRMSATGKRPLIRILIGIPIGVVIGLWDMSGWLDTVIDKGWDLTVYMASNHTQIMSWNHAKIIAADGKKVIVGGHNLWHNSYMSFAPIHDVSVRIDGNAAIDAHKFCNKLWTKPFDSIKWHEHHYVGKKGPMFDNFPNTSPGSTKALSLGRLGAGLSPKLTINSDASVFARITAILSAKKEIRIAQQGFGLTLNNIGNFDAPTMAALAKVIHRGVMVDIVVSNDGAKDGGSDSFSGSSIYYQCGVLASFLEYELSKGFPPIDDPEAYYKLSNKVVNPAKYQNSKGFKFSQATANIFAERVYFSSLRFYKPGGDWQYEKKKRIPGYHGKIYIIDDTNFYVGSDNMYRSATNHGLQEFGYLVEGRKETDIFTREYWNTLWKYSKLQRHTYLKE